MSRIYPRAKVLPEGKEWNVRLRQPLSRHPSLLSIANLWIALHRSRCWFAASSRWTSDKWVFYFILDWSSKFVHLHINAVIDRSFNKIKLANTWGTSKGLLVAHQVDDRLQFTCPVARKMACGIRYNARRASVGVSTYLAWKLKKLGGNTPSSLIAVRVWLFLANVSQLNPPPLFHPVLSLLGLNFSKGEWPLRWSPMSSWLQLRIHQR